MRAGASNSAGVGCAAMASPCSNCRRAEGKLEYVYIATFPQGQRRSSRLRLCPTCFEAFIPDLLSVADEQDVVGRWLAPEAR